MTDFVHPSSIMVAATNEYNRIPPAVREAIDAWVEKGWQPGHFVTGVLTNNLFEAIGRADVYSMAALPAICGYVFNELPSACWGSVEKCQEWAKSFADAFQNPGEDP